MKHPHGPAKSRPSGYAQGGLFALARYTNDPATSTDANTHYDDGIMVYPNPSAGDLTVEWKGGTTALLRVVDALGTIVSEQRMTSPARLSVPARGIHFLRITDDAGMVVSREDRGRVRWWVGSGEDGMLADQERCLHLIPSGSSSSIASFSRSQERMVSAKSSARGVRVLSRNASTGAERPAQRGSVAMPCSIRISISASSLSFRWSCRGSVLEHLHGAAENAQAASEVEIVHWGEDRGKSVQYRPRPSAPSTAFPVPSVRSSE
ncbi:MAG: T9SS type A sorting domain-containing protein [Flavobacteriales bacterium]|nr:T9SS type A sorting domain-containing protein [Flavobacteriales bacterium]